MAVNSWRLGVALSLFVIPVTLHAGPQSLLNPQVFAPREPVTRKAANAAMTQRGASLFAGRRQGAIFDLSPLQPDGIAGLRTLIASAEAGPAGYDAVQHGARIRPKKRPTMMTIAEIYAWIDRTPGQPHAIGRYQFIPATLRRLVRDLGLKPSRRFSPDVQDRLADLLLAEAGIHAFLANDMSQQTFMENLAKIWAGLPTSSGRSHYHGYAGNKATMTWARFEKEMNALF